jgi:hypothetical protein
VFVAAGLGRLLHDVMAIFYSMFGKLLRQSRERLNLPTNSNEAMACERTHPKAERSSSVLKWNFRR